MFGVAYLFIIVDSESCESTRVGSTWRWAAKRGPSWDCDRANARLAATPLHPARGNVCGRSQTRRKSVYWAFLVRHPYRLTFSHAARGMTSGSYSSHQAITPGRQTRRNSDTSGCPSTRGQSLGMSTNQPGRHGLFCEGLILSQPNTGAVRMADDWLGSLIPITDGNETARIRSVVTVDGLVHFTRHEEPV